MHSRKGSLSSENSSAQSASSPHHSDRLSIRRALFTVSDKTGMVELARSLQKTGTEIIATGRTAQQLKEAGISVIPIEEFSGNPEAFQGRMKTLSFSVCSGILYRRGNQKDEDDLNTLNLKGIDCVVVNFYPFEKAVAEGTRNRAELIEEVDIGGPTLVRAAAKNSPDVLVLTSPSQYPDVIQQLQTTGAVEKKTVDKFASQAWDRVLEYDQAIAWELGSKTRKKLRYGENPHQEAELRLDNDSPIAWDAPLTPAEISYNNVLDLSAAYSLASDLSELFPDSTSVVIVKHNNPCGVATVPKSHPHAQKMALTRAWEGDSVSAFGGVVLFTTPIEFETAEWLSQHFIELVAAPEMSLNSKELSHLLSKRKNLKALTIRKLGEMPKTLEVLIPGGKLIQSADTGSRETLKTVTRREFPDSKKVLAQFGIAITKALKSNAISVVREVHGQAGIFQLIGAGQGQPNRVDALKSLALPRAQNVLRVSDGTLQDCVLVSDAFFPFRDTVDAAHAAGIQWIVQPGGSMRDQESVEACDGFNMAMAFTGVRHFKH